MLGDEMGRLLPRLFGWVFKLLKWIFKIGVFFGIHWFVIALAPALIFEIVTGKGTYNVPVMYWISKVLIWIAVPLAIMTFIQNVGRMIKKDRSFNIFAAILGITGRGGKKGFEAKLGGDAVALKDAGDLSGVVFGKLRKKYVIMPETTDGHILVIGGAGSGKTSAIAIPTLMSWKERVFAIDIR